MRIALTHRSALEALSSIGCRGDVAALPRLSLPAGFSSSAGTADVERLCSSMRLHEPVQVLSSESANRRPYGALERHRFNPLTMSWGFVELEPRVWACSPELCFIQLCTELDMVDATRLLGWMAGTYLLDLDGNLDVCAERAPLLTRDSLTDALVHFKGVHGAMRARRVVRYAPFCCASPKETEVGILLQLPVKLGGCGFPPPKINYEHILTPAQRRLLRRQSFKCDYFWPEKAVAVEYDSKGYHMDFNRIEGDAVRKNDIQYLGINVMSLCWSQLKEYSEFEKFAVQLASHLGLRLRDAWDRYRPERMRLHRRLLFDRPSVELVSFGFGRFWK